MASVHEEPECNGEEKPMSGMTCKNVMGALRRWSVGSVSALALSVAITPTWAVAEAKSFDIDAQPLSKALIAFSKQSDFLVVAPTDLVQGKTAPYVSGNLEPEDALELLLKGSGLKHQRGADGEFTIVKASSGYGEEMAEAGADLKDTGFVLEEIIVTATKRSSSMQDVPMSINAFSGDRLEQSGVAEIQDLPFLAAGLHVTEAFGNVQLTLRGVGTNQIPPGAEPGVASHRDGVYLGHRPDIGLSFFDIERIEVLRGPQGTLYGRNATGGAVNIITKDPTEEFEAGGRVTFGNYSLVETEGYVSGSLIEDKLSGRVAFTTRKRDGYLTNLHDGSKLDDDDTAAVRAKLRYTPSESFKLDLGLDYGRSNGFPFEVIGLLPTARTVNVDADNIMDVKVWGANALAEWNFENVTLTSVTGYRELDLFLAKDFDYSPNSSSLAKEIFQDSWQFSQELTLSSAGDSPLEWIVGGYYFTSELTEYIDFRLPGLGATLYIITPELSGTAYAVFGEASYPIIENLTLTVGARYSEEDKYVHQSSEGFGALNVEMIDSKWTAFTPKAALSYEFNDALTAYVTVGKGFKGGGYLLNTLQGRSFDPEKVTNYEAGIKALLLDERLRFNMSVFHMDYSDLQVKVFRIHPITGGIINGVDNAAASKIRGAEIEIDARPTDALSIDGNLSYLDASYKSWPDAIDINRGSATFDVSGNRMISSPRWVVNLGASYMVPVGDWGTATLRGEYSYKSRIYFTPFEEQPLSQKPVSVVNARLTFAEADGQWQIAAYVKNVTDELMASETRGNALNPISNLLPPRTYGVSVGYNF